MPNGFHGPDDAWRRMEAPLLGLDPVLERFARDQGLAIRRNHHNWPERSLIWGEPIRRLIQIYLEDEETLTWNLWLCASEDRGSSRYWKNAFLLRAAPIEDLERTLPDLLEEARRRVDSWSSDQLEFAAKLGT